MTEFQKSVAEFLDSLEKSFTYLNSDVLKDIRKHVQENPDVMVETGMTLFKYVQQLKHVMASKKLKNNDYKFLNDIKLFEKLSLDQFKGENKKTKHSICSHLNNILATSLNHIDPKLVQESIPFIESIDIERVKSTIDNNDILSNLVESVTEQIQRDNINPSELLMGMLSNPSSIHNGKFKKIYDLIQNDVQKIDKGTLDTITKDFSNMFKK